MLSITSDYFQSTGDPQPYLRRIAEAGFTHVHWCHEWATDRIYTSDEIHLIKGWFQEYGLQLLNLHGSHGQEKHWFSQDENRRQAGIALVQNRIRMTATLGGEVIIMHIPSTAPAEERQGWLVQIRKSLDDLQPFSKSHAVRMALENMVADDFEMLETILAEYDPGFLGFCYDAGHANIGGEGIMGLERLKDRLIAVHLHDNDGSDDQHKIPFTGTVDWTSLTAVIASSAYRQCVNLEVLIRETGIQDESEFLRQAHAAGDKLTQLIENNIAMQH